MKITTYKVENYRDCPIYFRNFLTHFEYLTIIKKQLYTAHISMKPMLINKVFHWLGIEKSIYSEQQQAMAVKCLRRMAETTIDFVKDGQTTVKYEVNNKK